MEISIYITYICIHLRKCHVHALTGLYTTSSITRDAFLLPQTPASCLVRMDLPLEGDIPFFIEEDEFMTGKSAEQLVEIRITMIDNDRWSRKSTYNAEFHVLYH